jgi:hypothetical protein
MAKFASRELIRHQVTTMKILDPDLVDIITNLSEEYLKTL